MPLESLSDEQINIHDLTLEQEKQPESKAEQLFKELKDTPLYNARKKMWYVDMDQHRFYSTNAQIFGILATAQFDITEAKELYENLRRTNLYNNRGKEWNYSMDNFQTVYSSIPHTEVQLLGVLLDAQFDKDEAKKRYDALIKTPLYDPEKKQWNYTMKHGQERDRITGDQLLGVLCAAQFDKAEAIRLYGDLMKIGLYDPEKKQWKASIINDNRIAGDQLLGVLCAAQFDKESAKKFYESLKQGPLYDQTDQQWNGYIAGGHVDKKKLTTNQLLGILCEQLFDETEPNIQTSTSPLPETRSY